MSINYLYKETGDNNCIIQYAWFAAMHTRIDMVFYHKSKDYMEKVACQIYDEVIRYEKIADFYNPESELYTINQQASQGPIQINNELYRMLDLCLNYNEKTFGCFDVTVQSKFFDSETIKHVLLTQETQSVFYGRPDIKVDLSGFVKGYVLEKIREILVDAGLSNALISLGTSSVLALGNHPYGEGWKIDFRTNENKDAPTVLLQNQCLSTSGNETMERKHIISPFTGEYVDGISYAAVVTKNAIDGEVLSTALCVASQQQKSDISKQFDIEQIILF